MVLLSPQIYEIKLKIVLLTIKCNISSTKCYMLLILKYYFCKKHRLGNKENIFRI